MNTLRGLALVAATAALAACAVAPKVSPEEQVSARALERWKALMAGDVQKAYGYMSPASREVVSLDRFRRGFGAGGAWKDVKVHSVTCESAERCNVRLVVTFQPAMRGAMFPALESAVDEAWLLDSGQWWLPHKP